MLCASDCESARTCPSARITVTRAPPDPTSAAQRFRELRSSGCEDAEEGNSGGRTCANRAMVTNCSKVARSVSRRSTRSAKKSTATSTLTSSVKNVSASFQKRLRRTSFEQVPCAAYGLQMVGILRIGFDFLTQAAHVHVHATRRNE